MARSQKSNYHYEFRSLTPKPGKQCGTSGGKVAFDHAGKRVPGLWIRFQKNKIGALIQEFQIYTEGFVKKVSCASHLSETMVLSLGNVEQAKWQH